MEIRIDKWLWVVRLFKTRALATDACKKGKVMLNDTAVKPSKTIKSGDIIGIKAGPIIRSFKVTGLTQNRINAKLVPEFREEITAPDQLDLIQLGKLAMQSNRQRGTGRPTKKERRDLDDFFEPFFIDE